MTLSLETRVAFDALIVTVVAPELKRRGYRKRGVRWSRSRGNVKARIDVHEEPHAHAMDDVVFTFDFEVRTSDAGVAGRIGALLSEPIDVWWRVHRGVLSRQLAPRMEPELVTHELADLVARVADTIDSVTSTADVHAYMEGAVELQELGLLRLISRTSPT
jgi:hypothetical protein